MTARKVAILTTGLGAGGAERVIAQLARHWSVRCTHVTIITFDAPGDRIYHPLPDDVRLLRLDCSGGGLAGNFRRLSRLREALKAADVDVLISFLTKNNLLAALAKTGLPIKWIACERNNPERQNAHPMWNRMLDLAYRRADAIVCQTTGVRRCFPSAVKDRISVVPNPVQPVASENGWHGGRITAVGRLDRQKGFDLLIDAFAEIAAKHPDWALDIWGEGRDEAALGERVKQQGMGGRIILRGASDRPGGWIETSDLFVLSSRYEGFPNVLGEAMAAGLPVIATDCDFGPSDMVSHGNDGWLVPPENIASLAEALELMIADEDLRKRLADAAPAGVARFAPEKVTAQWDRVIDIVLAGGRSAKPVAGEVHPAE